uniref:Uncharacterized protein n=1 Tax=Oryza rufipogon TaxID=4529 RepID=A0A0E0R5F7_ORYRU
MHAGHANSFIFFVQVLHTWRNHEEILPPLLGLVRLGRSRPGSGTDPRGSPRRGNNPGPSEIVCSVKPSLGFTPAYPGLSPSPRPGKKSASRVAWKISSRREPGGDVQHAQRQHDAEAIRGGATVGAARRGGDGDGTALSSGRHLLSVGEDVDDGVNYGTGRL